MGVLPATPNTRFLLDSYDVSGFLNAGNQSWDAELIEYGTFATTGKGMVASGKYTEKATETIWFDAVPGAASIDAIIHGMAILDTPHYRGRAWGAHSEGYPIYETIEVLASKPLSAAEGQLLMMNAAWSQQGPTSRSQILRYAPSTAPITGTGAGTGFNQGTTPSTSKYQAVFRVLGGTFASVTLQIHQSTVDSGYTLMTGMTHTFTVPGVYRVVFEGATAAWKKSVVSAFTGTNAIVVVTGGIVHEP